MLGSYLTTCRGDEKENLGRLVVPVGLKLTAFAL
jgi:hypothetical protein